MPTYKDHRKRKDSRLLILIVFVVLIALIVYFGPKTAIEKALNINNDKAAVNEHSGILISEVMSANQSAFPDENGNFSDWVEIWNAGDAAKNLKGLTLSNRSDKAKFVFPNIILKPDERVVVFCDNSNQNDADKALHAKFKLSSLGGGVFLFDTSGYVLHSVEMPTLNADETYFLNEEGIFEKGENIYSPGYPNTREGHLAYKQNFEFKTGNLVINEIMAAPKSGLRDENGELQDWIELRNLGNNTIDLSKFAISDNPARPLKWIFPEGAIIAPNSYFILFASGKDRANVGGYPHTNFRLSAEGETVILSTRQGQLVDSVKYEVLPVDESYGRNETSNEWQLFKMATPGAPNNDYGAGIAEGYLRAINPSKVYISEVMSSNDSIKIPGSNVVSDWAELRNDSNKTYDLSLHGLSDDVSWPRKWQIPPGTVISPGEHKIIFLDKTPKSGNAGLHASYGLKRAGGETVTFSDPSGNVLDKIPLPSIPVDISYGRMAGKNGFFYFDGPTPGKENGIGLPAFSPMPVFSVPGGLYKENLTLSINGVHPDAVIRYTIDGSTPTLDNSMVYNGPITIKDSVVIRARNFVSGLQPSEVTTASYIMKTYYTMPVVSLTTDPSNLWNNQDGMLALGEGVDIHQYTKIPFRRPTPIYRSHGKIFRPGFAEMFDSDTGSVYFNQGVEFGLIGQYSLDMPQKSFKVKAKASMGQRYFNAKLFQDRPFEQYKSFVLRISGNDAVWTRIVDGVQSQLVDGVPGNTVVHQAWRPVIVYLNGAYWGHYNLRERVGRYFVAQHEGIPLEEADNMTILEASWKNYYGSNKEYREMIKKIKNSSPGTSDEDLQYILDNVDVDNLFDFLSYQIFFANTDSGNIRFYKIPGGKWKWIMFDMDYGLFASSNNGIRNMMNPKGHGSNDDIDNTIWLKLLENAEMRDRFLRRFGEIFQHLTTERMLQKIDEAAKAIEPELNIHFERWAQFNLKSISIEQPTTVDGCIRYWNSRVNRLRNVAKKRPRYCWVQVQDWYSLSDAQMEEYFGPNPPFPPDANLDKNDRKIQ